MQTETLSCSQGLGFSLSPRENECDREVIFTVGCEEYQRFGASREY